MYSYHRVQEGVTEIRPLCRTNHGQETMEIFFYYYSKKAECIGRPLIHCTERSPKRWLLLISLVQTNGTLPGDVYLLRQTATKKKVVKERTKDGRARLLKSCQSRVFCLSFGKLNLEARNLVIDTEQLLIAEVLGLPWLSAQSGLLAR